ncbi:selenocysteine lyase [Telmatospirillum siberiense]|uniref:cysteine desulfurase n=2 Tax=Telmatospirillum siberiense TaxID=382514 RepID=A0A2N3PQG8_9PROT|nr:selenocysteine lyase [Telmatospirillum siberiense]
MTFDARTIRRQFPVFAGRPGGLPLHYLDNAAMAQMPRPVIEALVAHDSLSRANVHRGLHPLAERADRAYDAARTTIARHLHVADPTEIVFTSGATASVNLLAQAFGAGLGPDDEIVVSRLDHHSNLVPWLLLAKNRGVRLRFLPVTADGRLDVGKAPDIIGPRCRLVAVTHASNVTGAVTAVAPLVAAARAVGAKVLLDGAQMLPHGSVDLPKLGVDFYCFSGHKVFAPTGIGVLWGRRELLSALPPPMGGGGMIAGFDGDEPVFLDTPQRFEAGTPPVTQAIGLAAALTWLDEFDHHDIAAHERRLTEDLLDGLASFPGVTIVGPRDMERRLPVVSFTVAGAHPHDICQILGGRGVALRGGALCAQPLMNDLDLPGVVRASLALYNDEADVAALLSGLTHAIKVLA